MLFRYKFTALIFCLFFITNLHSKHIIGGYMDYSVVASSNSNFILEVRLSVFRDPFGGGAAFDNNLELGLYRINENGDLIYVNRYTQSPHEIMNVESDFLNCRGTLPEYELGKYKIQVEIPNDGADYQLAYQRCCRSNSILGVVDVEMSGMLFTTRVNYEALTSMNTSPSLTNVDNRFFEINKMHDIEMSFIDVDGDEIVITPLTPFEVGGLDGVNFGDPTSCEGITPNPAYCPPTFDPITYETGFSRDAPFGEDGVFMNNGNSKFSFECQSMGMYLLGFKIEEFRNGELLTFSNYETTIITGLREANQVDGQLFLDENGNGILDAGEQPFPLAPDITNEFCNYTLDDENKYTLLLSPDIAEFKNNADNYTFSNGSNLISSPDLSQNLFTEFDIGFIPATSVEEMSMSVYNEFSLCNEEGILHVDLFNTGTLATEGQLVISNLKNITFLDCNCDFEYSGEDVVVQTSSLDPLTTRTLDLTVLYADETHVGEAVTADFKYSSSLNTENTVEVSFEDIILCAYDPNDIAVTPQRLPNYVVENHEQLIVKIRFENLGNWFASKVAIDQVLDDNLDAPSLKVLDASHPYTIMTSRNDEEVNLKVLFDDISLPGTNDPIQSNREGYITYSIDIKPNLPLGTLIGHRADIVFDLNQPILTNTVTNVIGILDDEIEEEEVEEKDEEEDEDRLIVFPNPAESVIYVRTGDEFVSYFISNSAQKFLKEGPMTKTISIEDLHPGVYMITFIHTNGHRVSKKIVKMDRG